MATAVKQRLPRVKFNAHWQKIHRHFDLGHVDGANKYLYFASRDHDLLRDMVRRDLGLDLLALDFNVERSQLAKHSHKEKFANIRPEANYLLVKLPLSAPESFAQLGLQMPALRVPVEQALMLCHGLSLTQILIVENLDSFDDIHRMNFDSAFNISLPSTLIVYRGSGAHSPAACKRLLQLVSEDERLTQTLTVTAFTDLDPAGLQIAHLLKGCTGLLMPACLATDPTGLASMAQMNDIDDFNKQFKQQAYLDNTNLGAWRALSDWIKANKVSIKQQHLLAHQVPLRLVML